MAFQLSLKFFLGLVTGLAIFLAANSYGYPRTRVVHYDFAGKSGDDSGSYTVELKVYGWPYTFREKVVTEPDDPFFRQNSDHNEHNFFARRRTDNMYWNMLIALVGSIAFGALLLISRPALTWINREAKKSSDFEERLVR